MQFIARRDSAKRRPTERRRADVTQTLDRVAPAAIVVDVPGQPSETSVNLKFEI